MMIKTGKEADRERINVIKTQADLEVIDHREGG